MTETPAVLGEAQLAATMADLPDWRARLGFLQTAYAAGSAAGALALIAAIGEAAEAANHHPDVDWRYDHVFVRTTTHQAGDQITAKDVDLAGRISELAAAGGAVAEPGVAPGMDDRDPAG